VDTFPKREPWGVSVEVIMNAIDVLKENVILNEAFLLSYGNPDRRIVSGT